MKKYYIRKYLLKKYVSIKVAYYFSHKLFFKLRMKICIVLSIICVFVLKVREGAREWFPSPVGTSKFKSVKGKHGH